MPTPPMHPWEDYPRNLKNHYLSMVGALGTAYHVGFGGENDPVHADLASMISRYQQLGMALNEMNRSMGMLDIVPEVFAPPVIEKLHFIHDLVHQGQIVNRGRGHPRFCRRPSRQSREPSSG